MLLLWHSANFWHSHKQGLQRVPSLYGMQPWSNRRKLWTFSAFCRMPRLSNHNYSRRNYLKYCLSVRRLKKHIYTNYWHSFKLYSISRRKHAERERLLPMLHRLFEDGNRLFILLRHRHLDQSSYTPHWLPLLRMLVGFWELLDARLFGPKLGGVVHSES